MNTEHIKTISIGADHGAFEAKEALKNYLTVLGYIVIDVGTFDSVTKVDYPDFAYLVAKKVATGECDRGIMLDAAGIGSSMVCNKVRGIRAALCWNGTSLHPVADLLSMSKLWLETDFEGGRHWPRINKMMSIEKKQY
jgi:ribose 5-phosphate isomerase B